MHGECGVRGKAQSRCYNVAVVKNKWNKHPHSIWWIIINQFQRKHYRSGQKCIPLRTISKETLSKFVTTETKFLTGLTTPMYAEFYYIRAYWSTLICIDFHLIWLIFIWLIWLHWFAFWLNKPRTRAPHVMKSQVQSNYQSVHGEKVGQPHTCAAGALIRPFDLGWDNRTVWEGGALSEWDIRTQSHRRTLLYTASLM